MRLHKNMLQQTCQNKYKRELLQAVPCVAYHKTKIPSTLHEVHYFSASSTVKPPNTAASSTLHNFLIILAGKADCTTELRIDIA